MRKNYLLTILVLFFGMPNLIQACGYGSVSQCNTKLDVEKNGTNTVFYAAPCTWLTEFPNYNFGASNTLLLTRGELITWESCVNHVLTATLYYRVYEVGTTPGAFSAFSLNQMTIVAAGAYRTRTFQGFGTVDLLNGIASGDYVLEVYYEGQVDTNNDGIPDEVLLKDNAGSNYLAYFTKANNNTGNLTINFTNKTNVTCHGGNDGGVTASPTSGTAPYTYAWSNGATAQTLSNLSAGTYSVTVTDAASSTGSASVVITEPSIILPNASSTDETSASANNGTATANPSGGNFPYSYNWSNNTTTQTITGLDSGSYTVTVTDANGCTASQTVIISISGNNPTNYCAATSTFPWVDFISNVTFNTINNNSGKHVYNDFISQNTTVGLGTNYAVSVSATFSWDTHDEYIRIWIDYNRDGIFQEPTEIAFSGMLPAPAQFGTTETLNGNITIPATADEGLTRMRVIMTRNNYASPCGTIDSGEIEDYSVNLSNMGGGVCSLAGNVTNVNCNNNGTNLDPNDDTFSFDLTVTGNATSAAWNAVINGQNETGSYGVTQTFGPFLISGGNLNFTIEDSNDANCNDLITVTAPATCSNGVTCSISHTVNNIVCNDNGTNTDPSDDTFTFDLTVTGVGTGTGWAAVINGQNQTGSYDTPQTFGPFLISNGNLNFTVEDQSQNTCSTSVSVTAPSPCSNGGGGTGTYCQSVSTLPWHDWISGVEMGSIVAMTGKSIYTDNTNMSTSVVLSEIVTINLTAGYSWFTYDEYWSVWIDFNQDGDFDDPNESVVSLLHPAPPNGTLDDQISTTFTIPATALLGTTRMRVSMKREAFATPCESLPHGEVEDYSVEILGTTGNRSNDQISLKALPKVNEVELFSYVSEDQKINWTQTEKSTDGLHYFPLIIENQEDAVMQSNLFKQIDQNPEVGLNYYRLKVHYTDGFQKFSPIQIVDFQPVLNYSVFPNPASDRLNIQTKNFIGKDVHFMIMNQLGQILYDEVIPKTETEIYSVDLKNWRDGNYFIYMDVDGQKAVSKQFFVAHI